MSELEPPLCAGRWAKIKIGVKIFSALERKINSQASANCSSSHLGRAPWCRGGVTASGALGTSLRGHGPAQAARVGGGAVPAAHGPHPGSFLCHPPRAHAAHHTALT